MNWWCNMVDVMISFLSGRICRLSILYSCRNLKFRYPRKFEQNLRGCTLQSLCVLSLWSVEHFLFIVYSNKGNWHKKIIWDSHSGYGLIALKLVLWYISKNYLTTNDPYCKRVQKNFKIRKLYSPDPDSGSVIPEIWDHFFS